MPFPSTQSIGPPLPSPVHVPRIAASPAVDDFFTQASSENPLLIVPNEGQAASQVDFPAT